MSTQISLQNRRAVCNSKFGHACVINSMLAPVSVCSLRFALFQRNSYISFLSVSPSKRPFKFNDYTIEIFQFIICVSNKQWKWRKDAEKKCFKMIHLQLYVDFSHVSFSVDLTIKRPTKVFLNNNNNKINRKNSVKTKQFFNFFFIAVFSSKQISLLQCDWPANRDAGWIDFRRFFLCYFISNCKWCKLSYLPKESIHLLF